MLTEAHDLELDQADRGPRNAAAATERMCVATRTVRPVGELIRFVAGPDGAGARSQAPVAGPRRVGERPPQPGRGRGQATGLSEEPAGRRQGPFRPRRNGRWAVGAFGARCPVDRPQGLPGGHRVSPGSRRPSPGGRWLPCSRPGMRARRGPASSRRRWCGAARGRSRWKSCRPSPVINWIWHWAA